MESKLQNNLVEEYKEFFEYLRDYKGPIIPIQFGFECGDGWFVILDELMSNIQHHIKNENRNRDHRLRSKFALRLDKIRYRLPWKWKKIKAFLMWIVSKFPRGVEHMPTINVTQIKEKFGGLCFYFDGGDDHIWGMVSLAESLSYRTCEYCGSTNNVGQTQGWIITACKACMDSEPRLKDKIWRPVKKNIVREGGLTMIRVLDEKEEDLP